LKLLNLLMLVSLISGGKIHWRDWYRCFGSVYW
jgi:nitric oxide synthase oxygenase domain/subunit